MSCEVINPTAALPELGEVSACTYTTHVLLICLHIQKVGHMD